MAYDTLLGYLDGTLRYADAPSTIYVAEIKGHPDFLKIGFCQLSFRNQRLADPYIGAMLYETCKDRDQLEAFGDLSRADAFLIEQFLHESLTRYREVIPELQEVRWSGRFETFRLPGPARDSCLEWLSHRIGSLRYQGFDGYEEMLDQLVSTAEEQELYAEHKERWAALRAKTRSLCKFA